MRVEAFAILGYTFASPFDKDDTIWRFILGFPYLRKLPFRNNSCSEPDG